ncbi:MAG: hypothetical protein HW412_967 [Bacteroidetes bacterium]|nr:hypothetical protein [Bacteroidota bacterium]
MFETLLIKLATALQQAGIPYMVIGGQAVLQYGEPRLTRDIDITLGVDSDRLSDVLALAQQIGLQPAVENVESFVKTTNVLPVSEEATGIRVDLVFSFSQYEQAAIEHANPISVGNSFVRYANVEDTIIHKIVAGRPRDLEDVKGMLTRHPNHDAAYIEKWLKSLGQSLTIDLIARFKSISQ